MVFTESYKYVLKNITNVLSTIELQKVQKTVSLIDIKKQIFVYGAGRSGLIGKTFAMRLVQLGLTAYFIGETITPLVKKDDIVFLISNTGETKSTLLVATICKNIGANVVVITSSKESSLSSYGDIVFEINPMNGDTNLAPLGTLFESSVLVFFDSLITQIMQHLNEDETSMRNRHAIWV